MQEIHQALRDTRGAAVAVARIEPDMHRVLFCGVGNKSAAIATATTKNSLLSMPGTAGHKMYRLRTFTYPLPPGSALVLHSDGISTRWTSDTLPALLRHSPTVIAAHLLHSAGKYHDDASVTVARGLW
ncbi:SpoIIE family protein phosphatase [Streptomyces sp. NPDC091272]|uniref:SpoIIE family protein phosphatase n=1 Tax=Streptomyces sp. NPDC091272 TaxID=3365981 RepID=UPI00380AA3EF